MFGLYGTIQAQPNQRDALLEILLKAAQLVGEMDGCHLYIVNAVAESEDQVSVFEVWRDEAAHQASLQNEAVRDLITSARPLLGGAPTSVKLVTQGGAGL